MKKFKKKRTKCEYCGRIIIKSYEYSIHDMLLCQTCFIKYLKGKIRFKKQEL